METTFFFSGCFNEKPDGIGTEIWVKALRPGGALTLSSVVQSIVEEPPSFLVDETSMTVGR